MNQKILKAWTRPSMIANEFVHKARYFSFSYGIYSTAWWLGWYVHPLKRLCMWGFKHKDKYVKNYLFQNYTGPIDLYRKNLGVDMVSVSLDEYPIWVFWFQGFEFAPPLVQACFENLKRKNKNVIAIDKNNLDTYLQLPSYIKQKVVEGKITFTHYSDIIRVSLLAEYGGMWIDATCFTSTEMPKSAKERAFYSSKTVNQNPLPLWSNSRWCGWGQGTCYKHYPLFVFLKDILYTYWKQENLLIDYLLLDAVMEIGIEENQRVHEDMDSLPTNNLQRNNLWLLMNQTFSMDKYKELTNDTWLYKLSYKTQLQEMTESGEETFYKKILNQDLN